MRIVLFSLMRCYKTTECSFNAYMGNLSIKSTSEHNCGENFIYTAVRSEKFIGVLTLSISTMCLMASEINSRCHSPKWGHGIGQICW